MTSCLLNSTSRNSGFVRFDRILEIALRYWLARLVANCDQQSISAPGDGAFSNYFYESICKFSALWLLVSGHCTGLSVSKN